MPLVKPSRTASPRFLSLCLSLSFPPYPPPIPVSLTQVTNPEFCTQMKGKKERKKTFFFFFRICNLLNSARRGKKKKDLDSKTLNPKP